MNNRDIYFPLKDAGLREDVGVLGALVGEVIEEQAGERLFEEVETSRRAAIRWRQGDTEAQQELRDILTEAEDTGSFVRAFSVFFQVVNLAERVHRIRRRRDYLRSGSGPQPGGVDAALQQLASAGVGLDDLQGLLDRICLFPVFTAHPTEATRRSILQKHLRIARRLVERLDPTLTPLEARRMIARLRGEITALWQTEEHPEARRTVSDESEHILFYLTEILYRVVPPFYEAIRDSIMSVYGAQGAQIRLPTLMKFGSWVGADMDGNPNVTADTVLDTLRKHRTTILSLYRRELEGLYEQLTQSEPQVCTTAQLRDITTRYESMFPHVSAQFPARHARMPYRRIIRLIQARLTATAGAEDQRYKDAPSFIQDIETIATSLRENGGANAGLFQVERLLRRAQTFQFHLASLDIRQDSLVHRDVIGRVLGDTTWMTRSPDERTSTLLDALANPQAPSLPDDDDVRGTLAVLQAVRLARSEIGPDCIGPYIVSMSRQPEDILGVLLLAAWSGLVDGDQIPLDVAPLFETVDDLVAAPNVLDALFTNDAYRRHLKARENQQIVMIGYSDSGKDDGIAAARWALHEAQSKILAVARRHDVELTLFHGRGGTISRGGGTVDQAVAAAPEAYASGRLRLTEQGEVINQRYGLRDIAERSAEQMFAPVVLASSGALEGTQQDNWAAMAATIATQSRKTYRALVHEETGFFDYFRSATPIDVIERMRIGSRPSSRRTQHGIRDLRAIPWVFAWTQSRHVLTGWCGAAAGLEAAVKEHGREEVMAAIAQWPFLSGLLSDVETDLASADLEIASAYARLTGQDTHPIFRQIEKAHEQTVQIILELKCADELLEHDDVLRRSIRLRNPYIDPISLLQVDLLRQWRAGDHQDDDLLGLLVGTVHGISQGLQNTG